jgi:hypothetical protein
MSDVFTHAGPLGYLVLLGALVGIAAAAGMAGLAFTRRRVPLALIVLIPYLLLAVGAFGAWISTGSVLGEVASAEPNRIPVVAMAGAWNAMTVDWLARWAAAFVLVAGTWAAAVGSAMMAGEEARFTPIAAAGAAVVTVLGAGVLFGFAYNYGLGSGAYMLGFLVLLGGLGVAAAASRRATDDEMFRVAGMRFAASMALLFAVWHGMRAVDIGNRIKAFAADGPVLNTPDILKAIELFSTTVDPGLTIGIVSLVIALVIAFFGFFSEIGEVVIRYTVFDMFAVVALMALVGVLRIAENTQFGRVYTVATNLPAVEMYEEMGAALGSSMMTRGEVAVPVRLADGGFGDMYAYEPDNTIELKPGEERPYHWVREYKWNGRRWVEDGSKLDEVSDHSDRPPLFAVERSMPADLLLEALEKTGNKGLLMLRSAEVKPGTFVPPELARLQTTFLPVEIRERNLKTDLWVVAGSPEVNFGPTLWFGDKDDSLDPIEYTGAALASTQSSGIHALSAGRKVGDIITTCLPVLVDAAPSADGVTLSTQLTMNATRWCSVTKDDPVAVRTEAAGLWDLPAPANVKMEIVPLGPVADTAQVNDLVRRELGGLGYCAEKAVTADPPEVLKGRMSLKLMLSKDGTVYDTVVEPTSKVQSPAISRCAAKRFRKLQFTMLPPGEPPAPAPAPKGRGRGRAGPPEPPPPPHVLVHLDF